jgi:hypothetical protein
LKNPFAFLFKFKTSPHIFYVSRISGLQSKNQFV